MEDTLAKDESQAIQTYKLHPVTYGTASGPYLAKKCQEQLVIDHQKEFPLESSIVQNDFYVDDLLTGASTVNEAIIIRRNIEELLRKGGFELSKWSSNNQSILADLSKEGNNMIQIDKNENFKTLSLFWNSTTDTFQFSIKVDTKNTKRFILSTISRLFDPLGLVSPIIVNAKLIMQYLRQAKVGWDEPLPEDIYNLAAIPEAIHGTK
ncbi:Pao retrotransposon peptidase [Popillia japonica]|uniref:Pao retrotransposon peptidase n=1 Tax=Popillia japonica TaxID=7064 RepID=A0AAW1M708_POPJA